MIKYSDVMALPTLVREEKEKSYNQGLPLIKIAPPIVTKLFRNTLQHKTNSNLQNIKKDFEMIVRF